MTKIMRKQFKKPYQEKENFVNIYVEKIAKKACGQSNNQLFLH